MAPSCRVPAGAVPPGVGATILGAGRDDTYLEEPVNTRTIAVLALVIAVIVLVLLLR